MSVQTPGTRWYNAVWRWHFYAGLFCIPFVLWLALTGSIYLWKPQIEALLDRPYDHLSASGPRLSPERQVAAALAAVPGSTLRKYQLAENDAQAVRIIVGKGGEETRVYVNPYTGAILKTIGEESQPMRLIFHLHGELMAGAPGSYLVEIAACWAVVMLLTGLYLWWPRKRRGLAGVLYPRLRGGKRVFWRDLHAVAGIWVSVFALFLIVTGLPWAKAWGEYFKEVRQVTGTLDGPQDWTIGGRAPESDEHAEHHAHAALPVRTGPGQLDNVVTAVVDLGIAPPVMIAPPRAASGAWTVTSDAANRPLRTRLTIDGATGRILSHKDFGQRHWIDRAVGYGIAAHEGALFGVANQLLGTATALFLMLLAVSGAILWWRRRPEGLLGAPIPLRRPRFGPVLILAIALLGLLMPLFGATLLAVLLVERLLLRRLPRARRWLGLSPAPA